MNLTNEEDKARSDVDTKINTLNDIKDGNIRNNQNAQIANGYIYIVSDENNFSDYKKDALRLRGETPPAYSSFKDVLAVSSWATDSLKWAVENGLIKGTDIGLEPQKTATRAQVAQLMYNYIASR